MSRGRANYFVLLLIMMCAFAVIFSFVPQVGYINLGGQFFSTTLFLPVAAAAVMLGPGAGAFVGLFAGLCRFAAMSFVLHGSPIAPFFTPFAPPVYVPATLWSLATCLLPPLLAGIFAGTVARRLDALLRSRSVCFFAAGFLGAFANWGLTHLCINAIYTFAFAPQRYIFWPATLDSIQIDAPAECLAAALICAIPIAIMYKKYVSHN